jgi:hypothetical protein
MTAITYVAGNPAHISGPNGIVTRVVLHATVSPCAPGGARSVARYFQSIAAGGLAHYVVDPLEVIQCAGENVATWHAPPNHGSIGVEMCDPQAGDPARWADHDHTAMLHLTAALVAGICHRHALPLVYVDAAGLIAGHHGITTHHEVSKAFGLSSHTDPDQAGPWPLAQLLEWTRLAAATATPAPTPTPAPVPNVTVTGHRNPYAAAAGPCRLGSTGDAVRYVQWATGAAIDGSYGPQTLDDVRLFQHRHGLAADGIVGPLTLAVMAAT